MKKRICIFIKIIVSIAALFIIKQLIPEKEVDIASLREIYPYCDNVSLSSMGPISSIEVSPLITACSAVVALKVMNSSQNHGI